GGRLGPFGPPASASAVRERLGLLGRDDAHRVILAEIDGEIVGLAVLSRLPITPISDVESIQISFMHVRNDRRRTGVGKAIVESAAAFATDVGADYVTVGVFPGSRDTNRYFARLGFSPLVIRRAIATSLLQRKLAGDDGVREVLTRRRRGRRQREY
ncbi:MAG: GNAT family N-acetyltransferase, partial [Candidatus Nanopelagicales bacterium]